MYWKRISVCVSECVPTPVFPFPYPRVTSVCPAVSPEPPPARLLPRRARPSLPPSDSLAACPERLIVFESCRDVKRSRSPVRGYANNKPSTSSEVRGNATSQPASLNGSGTTVMWADGIDESIPFQRETCALSPFPCHIYGTIKRTKYNDNITFLSLLLLQALLSFIVT